MLNQIQNREEFLNHIASRLGRERITTPVSRPKWIYRPQDEVLINVTPDELLDVFKEQCKKIHTNVCLTERNNLAAVLKDVIVELGGGPIVAWKDKRFTQWGLDSLLKEEWESFEWDPEYDEENINRVEKANIGITISEITLAESGTVVLFADKNKGRTVSFLPAAFIALIPKSSLVPRITQAAVKMREIYHQTGQVPSCINFITGPSNSADIELNLVVGVHGPVKAYYIVINDL